MISGQGNDCDGEQEDANPELKPGDEVEIPVLLPCADSRPGGAELIEILLFLIGGNLLERPKQDLLDGLVTQPAEVSLFTRLHEEKKDFGVVYSFGQCRGSMASITGTPRMLSVHHSGSPVLNFLRFSVKKGELFEVISLKASDDNRMKLATVRILPNKVVLPKLVFPIRLRVLDKLRLKHKTLVAVDGTAGDEGKLKRKEVIAGTVACMDAASLPFPKWVYETHNNKWLVEQIRKSPLGQLQTCTNLPSDPQELSLWLTKNLALGTEDMSALSQFNCCTQTLRYVLNMTTIFELRLCCPCGEKIGRPDDILPLSMEELKKLFLPELLNVIGSLLLPLRSWSNVWAVPDSGQDLMVAPAAAGSHNGLICVSCQLRLGWKFQKLDDSMPWPHLLPSPVFILRRKGEVLWSLDTRKDETIYLCAHC